MNNLIITEKNTIFAAKLMNKDLTMYRQFMAKGLSKSCYTQLCQCPKALWQRLNLFKLCRVMTNEDEVKNRK